MLVSIVHVIVDKAHCTIPIGMWPPESFEWMIAVTFSSSSIVIIADLYERARRPTPTFCFSLQHRMAMEYRMCMSIRVQYSTALPVVRILRTNRYISLTERPDGSRIE